MKAEKNRERFERYKKTLIAIITKHLPDVEIILFGSRARKTNREGADIDLGLKTAAPIEPQQLNKIYADIDETTIPLLIDLIDLQTAPQELLDAITNEGVVWETSTKQENA